MSADPLNVLAVAATPFFSDRGCHIRVRDSILELQARGHRATLVTYHLGRDVPGVEARRIKRVGWYRRTAAGPSPGKPLLDLFLAREVARATRLLAPDLLYAHLHEGGAVALAARSLTRTPIPIVVDLQDSLAEALAEFGWLRRGSLPFRAVSRIESKLSRNAELIVTSTEATARLARENYGVESERVIVVPDHPAPQLFATERGAHASDSASPHLAAVPAGAPLLIYTGSLLAVKGLDALRSAIRCVLAANPSAHVLVIGYPEQPLRSELAGRPGGDRVHFTGRVPYERIDGYLARADVAIEPKGGAAREGNLKVANYMAAALPVVCFDTPGNKDLLGDAGCYAHDGDGESLGRLAAELLSERERAHRVGERSRARMRERMARERGAERLDEAMRKLAERGRARGRA